MKKLAALAAVATVAILSSVSLTTPSSADPAGAAIAGGVLGFMAGAAIAGAGPHYVYHDSDYGRWRGYGGRWGYVELTSMVGVDLAIREAIANLYADLAIIGEPDLLSELG